MHKTETTEDVQIMDATETPAETDEVDKSKELVAVEDQTAPTTEETEMPVDTKATEAETVTDRHDVHITETADMVHISKTVIEKTTETVEDVGDHVTKDAGDDDNDGDDNDGDD